MTKTKLWENTFIMCTALWYFYPVLLHFLKCWSQPKKRISWHLNEMQCTVWETMACMKPSWSLFLWSFHPLSLSFSWNPLWWAFRHMCPFPSSFQPGLICLDFLQRIRKGCLLGHIWVWDMLSPPPAPHQQNSNTTDGGVAISNNKNSDS